MEITLLIVFILEPSTKSAEHFKEYNAAGQETPKMGSPYELHASNSQKTQEINKQILALPH
jgi:hypothetical protein